MAGHPARTSASPLLCGAFLTLAIVVGEFTIALFLARPAFGPTCRCSGDTSAVPASGRALISFGLTWLAMIFIAVVGRGGAAASTVAGAR